ncbi:MAG: hydantoinase B/oxoprolinase family protein [Planctomyces sp.]|nr:hydantoinase B/oxoprolinase family protein [Planctomyces sp.]
MQQFWIDVGGTFTDCISQTPAGELRTHKTLSSGRVPGRIGSPTTRGWIDPRRIGDPPRVWLGWNVHAGDFSSTVVEFDAARGEFTLAAAPPAKIGAGTSYELECGAEAPIVAIRHLLGLAPGDPLPEADVRLGTTRGTNALLEGKGARTALITTRGFADLLHIGNQDRPRLFDLAIRKPFPLFAAVIEADERVAADGEVLRPLESGPLAASLRELQRTGVESLAICLLNAYANPAHEELVESAAREAGFEEISVSSRAAPRIKVVTRGDTTVLDAYLNPILRRYVAGLQDELGAAGRLRLMTSAGGLVEASRFSGKDSILSGPAGGVIGFARVGEQAGLERTIGFDMGGTSTDVSRYDGRFEYEFETQKAGVRVAAPTLAVETVAAGGGSICRFDGIKLVVGPESAGATPGPACYGRGGPLTVTDVNVALGRLPAQRFPFPLDLPAVESRLAEALSDVQTGTGRATSREELAAGFIAVANASMARAIRRISTAKGYDPAEYALVCFGGAGGLHACALARELGLSRILLHPFAGLLSAYGMGLAEIQRHGERPVLKPLSAESLREVGAAAGELEADLRSQLRSEGVPEERIASRRTLDLRYRGVDAAINVDWRDNVDPRERYESEHERLYGYRRPGRPVEIAAVRVECGGGVPPVDGPAEASGSRRPDPAERTRVWTGEDWRDVPLFIREQLRPGDELEGPAVFCEPTSTVWIEEGFRGSVLARGELLLEDVRRPGAESREAPPGTASEADPVLLEIYNHQFASIAEQMGLMLQRTAVSTNVKERLDFSCAVFDDAGRLVVNAPHIPVHLGAMGETVRRVLADNPDLGPGDVFVTNDPYRGGSHLPDVTVVTPVHSPEGDRLFFTASRAHHAEIGGSVPGSMPPFSTTLADEGVLIRNFRLVARGESREDALAALLSAGPAPSRNVADNLADIAAQVAANQCGARLLGELIAGRGWGQVSAYMRHIRESAARKMRQSLARVPDGRYARVDHLDDGSPIAVAISVSGDRATVDFAGTGPVLATNLNANRAIVTAAVLYVFRCLLNEDIPLNEGVLDPVEIVLPECLLNPPAAERPEDCAAIVGGNVETSQRVVDVLLGALGLAAASQGTMNNLTFGDSTFGYYETICGGSGATADADGADAVHTHMTNTRLTDPEVIERRYPVRVREFSIRRGSGGIGHRSGGAGVVRRIEFLAPLTVSMLSQRRGAFPPFGLEGGGPGAIGRNTLVRGGESKSLDGSARVDVQPGDELVIETPGGGGFGVRDPHAVRD